MHEGQSDNKIKTLRYLLIACSILLVVSLGFLFSAHQDLNLANNQIANLSLEKDQFATTVSKLEFNKAGMENQIAMFETTEWNTIRLAGVADSPKAQMVKKLFNKWRPFKKRKHLLLLLNLWVEVLTLLWRKW